MSIFYIKGNVPIVTDTVRVEGELRVFYDRKGQVVAKISIDEEYSMENPEEKPPEEENEEKNSDN